MKVVITVGGTGGHVYPAEALAKKLLSPNCRAQVLFAAGGLSTNKYFDRKSFLYKDVACGSFSARSLLRSFVHCFSLARGLFQSLRILKSFRPNVVVGFGTYHTLPVLAASFLLKIPYIIHEANVIPGKANRFFARHAKAVATHFSDSAAFFKVPVIETGMPIREEYRLNTMTKQQARAFFQLDPCKLTLFIFGGSQGAAAINRLFGEALPLTHEKEKDIQVLHFTGNRSSARELKLIYEKHGISAVVRDFETQMHVAWLAADVAISRAGASSIAEQIEMEVPGILIPYPYAGQHQDKNADWMVNNVKGVIKLPEKELTPQKLSTAIVDLISNEQMQLREMKEAIRNYKEQRPAYDLLSLVCEIGK